jgi:hypothetical protein
VQLALLGFIAGRWPDGPSLGGERSVGGWEREYEREKSTGEGEECERGVSEGNKIKKIRIQLLTHGFHILYESRGTK